MIRLVDKPRLISSALDLGLPVLSVPADHDAGRPVP